MVGRALPTPADEHPKIYGMKLWATNEVRSKSKFWLVPCSLVVDDTMLLLLLWCLFRDDGLGLCAGRYFLRKLKKVKKSNGQVLAINEVRPVHLLLLMIVCLLNLCGSDGFSISNIRQIGVVSDLVCCFC